MRSCGIVVEYNPFHNGHRYHAEKARELSGADVVVAVMSGNFLQRGEPAIIDKWARTKTALQNGVDLVVELPFSWAVQSADYFARGSIKLLQALKCDALCFGTDSDSLLITPNTVVSSLKKNQRLISFFTNFPLVGAIRKRWLKLFLVCIQKRRRFLLTIF